MRSRDRGPATFFMDERRGSGMFAESGDEMGKMLRPKSRKLLLDSAAEFRFDLFLFSAGGNDFVGEGAFGQYLNNSGGASAISWINTAKADALFDGLLQELKARDKVIDTRETLTGIEDWKDEIHPISEHFKKPAQEFRDAEPDFLADEAAFDGRARAHDPCGHPTTARRFFAFFDPARKGRSIPARRLTAREGWSEHAIPRDFGFWNVALNAAGTVTNVFQSPNRFVGINQYFGVFFVGTLANGTFEALLYRYPIGG